MLYLFHGPDDFSRSEKLAELKKAMGDPSMADLNYTQLEGRSVKLSEIQYQASAIPFLCDRRLVVVTNYLTELGRKAKEAQPLLDWLEKLSPTSDLVFVETESLDKRHPVFKVKAIQVIEFAAPDKKNLPKWILQRVKQQGGQINNDAVDMLARLVGPHLRRMNNELE
jgi:DNA polymerase-3 subunit delta